MGGPRPRACVRGSSSQGMSTRTSNRLTRRRSSLPSRSSVEVDVQQIWIPKTGAPDVLELREAPDPAGHHLELFTGP